MHRVPPLLLLLAACAASSSSAPPPCVLEAPTPDVPVAAPLATVRFTTRPLSEAFDTSVLIGSVRAEVLGVNRDDCAACDSCREAEACSTCDDCDACAADCSACVEQVRVTLPDVGPGTWDVSIANRYGQSAVGTIEVEGEVEGDDTAL